MTGLRSRLSPLAVRGSDRAATDVRPRLLDAASGVGCGSSFEGAPRHLEHPPAWRPGSDREAADRHRSQVFDTARLATAPLVTGRGCALPAVRPGPYTRAARRGMLAGSW